MGVTPDVPLPAGWRWETRRGERWLARHPHGWGYIDVDPAKAAAAAHRWEAQSDERARRLRQTDERAFEA